MSAERFDELLSLWQDGEATPDQLLELQGLLQSEPRHRRALVGSALLEAHLYARYERAGAARPPEATPSIAGWKRMRLDAVAAVLMISVAALAVSYAFLKKADPAHQVLAGAVMADGVPTTAPVEGATLVVRGDRAATLALKDGTQVTLSPGSAGIIREDGFELLRGGSSLAAAGPLRLKTPLATLSAQGAAFSADLGADSLVVAVSSGNVDVRFAGGHHALRTGDAVSFEPGEPDSHPRLPVGATLSLIDAVDKALAVIPGTVISAGLEDEKRRVTFTVSIARERKLHELDFDPKTGELLDQEVENKDQSSLAAASVMPLADAIRIALERAPGVAVEAELEISDGKLFAEVEILAEGGVRKIYIDVKTRQVVRILGKVKP